MDKTFDIAIVGAGIAGACSAILLARKGLDVIVFEQDSLPRHKVCGEFISNESRTFFKHLGIDPSNYAAPEISQIQLSSQTGRQATFKLSPGGFGMSRYLLDNELKKLMISEGVSFYENCKVTQVKNHRIETTKGEFTSRLVFGAHGKYSPAYEAHSQNSMGKNYVGVKYHLQSDEPADLIQLHGFKGGYCGFSKVEADAYCLCYLVEADQIKKHGSIENLERELLYKNPNLKRLFSNSTHLWKNAKIISNISFGRRSQSKNSVVYFGDAALTISPLSGNGMSMAAHSAKILSDLFDPSKSVDELMSDFNRKSQAVFGSRVYRARALNSIMLQPQLFSIALAAMSSIPPFGRSLVASMQGKPF